jgi:hypothetical protein
LHILCTHKFQAKVEVAKFAGGMMQKEISFSSLFEAAKQCIGCMAIINPVNTQCALSRPLFWSIPQNQFY